MSTFTNNQRVVIKAGAISMFGVKFADDTPGVVVGDHVNNPHHIHVIVKRGGEHFNKKLLIAPKYLKLVSTEDHESSLEDDKQRVLSRWNELVDERQRIRDGESDRSLEDNLRELFSLAFVLQGYGLLNGQFVKIERR